MEKNFLLFYIPRYENILHIYPTVCVRRHAGNFYLTINQRTLIIEGFTLGQEHFGNRRLAISEKVVEEMMVYSLIFHYFGVKKVLLFFKWDRSVP